MKTKIRLVSISAWTSSLRNWNRWQRSLTVIEVRTVVVSSHANVSNMHRTRRQIIKVKNGKKDRNKNRQRFDVQSLGQFKSLDQMPRLEYPPPPLSPPPHPAAAYHWYCRSSSLTEYATFLSFSFLSMEFIAELPYKSPRLSGYFHTFSFLTIILKTV